MFKVVDRSTGRFFTIPKDIDRNNHHRMGTSKLPSYVLGSDSEGDRPQRFSTKKVASLAILADYAQISDRLNIEEC